MVLNRYPDRMLFQFYCKLNHGYKIFFFFLQVENMRWIECLDDQLINLLHKYESNGRIAFIALHINENVVESMVGKIRKYGMQGMVFYLKHDVMDHDIDLEIWYTIQRAIELELTTIVLILPQEYSMRVIEYALANNLNNIGHTWVTINLNKKHLVYFQDQPIILNNIRVDKIFKREEAWKFVNSQNSYT